MVSFIRSLNKLQRIIVGFVLIVVMVNSQRLYYPESVITGVISGILFIVYVCLCLKYRAPTEKPPAKTTSCAPLYSSDKSEVLENKDTQAESSHNPLYRVEDSTWDYEYCNVGVYRPEEIDHMPNIGDVVEFEPEPENNYDSEAIAVYTVWGKRLKVGYLYRSRIKDMVNDWIQFEKGSIIGEVTRADNLLEIRIVFEKN